MFSSAKYSPGIPLPLVFDMTATVDTHKENENNKLFLQFWNINGGMDHGVP